MLYFLRMHVLLPGKETNKKNSGAEQQLYEQVATVDAAGDGEKVRNTEYNIYIYRYTFFAVRAGTDG